MKFTVVNAGALNTATCVLVSLTCFFVFTVFWALDTFCYCFIVIVCILKELAHCLPWFSKNFHFVICLLTLLDLFFQTMLILSCYEWGLILYHLTLLVVCIKAMKLCKLIIFWPTLFLIFTLLLLHFSMFRIISSKI